MDLKHCLKSRPEKSRCCRTACPSLVSDEVKPPPEVGRGEVVLLLSDDASDGVEALPSGETLHRRPDTLVF